jgi:hypothetical protein
MSYQLRASIVDLSCCLRAIRYNPHRRHFPSICIIVEGIPSKYSHEAACSFGKITVVRKPLVMSHIPIVGLVNNAMVSTQRRTHHSCFTEDPFKSTENLANSSQHSGRVHNNNKIKIKLTSIWLAFVSDWCSVWDLDRLWADCGSDNFS